MPVYHKHAKRHRELYDLPFAAKTLKETTKMNQATQKRLQTTQMRQMSFIFPDRISAILQQKNTIDVEKKNNSRSKIIPAHDDCSETSSRNKSKPQKTSFLLKPKNLLNSLKENLKFMLCLYKRPR